jgi:hypothetical protein
MSSGIAPSSFELLSYQPRDGCGSPTRNLCGERYPPFLRNRAHADQNKAVSFRSLAKEHTKSPQHAENKRPSFPRSLVGFAESEHGAENKANVVESKLDAALKVFAVRLGVHPRWFCIDVKRKELRENGFTSI